MKKFLLLFVFTVSLLGSYAQRTIKIDTKSADVEQWINRNFGKGQVPPFSFIYDGTPSERFIKKWNYQTFFFILSLSLSNISQALIDGLLWNLFLIIPLLI